MEVTTAVKRRRPRPEPDIFAYTLRIGAWKKMFHPAYYKTLIANTLSDIVRKGEFKHTIVGYLISDRRLCLILKISQLKVRKMLDLFYGKISGQIIKCLETIDRAHLKFMMKELNISFQNFSEDTFKEYYLRNDHLMYILTGRCAGLTYYNPQLERLKKRLHNYPFSSIANYLGGISPVIVHVISAKEWKERSSHHQLNNDHQ